MTDKYHWSNKNIAIAIRSWPDFGVMPQVLSTQPTMIVNNSQRLKWKIRGDGNVYQLRTPPPRRGCGLPGVFVKSEVWECWLSITGGAGTAFSCVQLHFDHWQQLIVISRYSIAECDKNWYWSWSGSLPDCSLHTCAKMVQTSQARSVQLRIDYTVHARSIFV